MEDYQEQSLGGRVFQRIRDDILNGKYKERDELREISLGKELGVSRTPVREALRRLELEGLVSIIPNKGAFVTGITAKDVKDIYAMRSSLEGLCARWATRLITDEQLAELEEIMMLSEFHVKREDEDNSEQICMLDEKFHSVLYEASGSRILGGMLGDFHKYVQLTRKKCVSSKERARKSIREHRQILRALQEGDADQAEQFANEHIFQVMQYLKRQEIETQG